MAEHGSKSGITRVVTLDRGRTTTVQNLQPGDTVTPFWNNRKGCWKLLIKSANGVTIRHVRLDGGVESKPLGERK